MYTDNEIMFPHHIIGTLRDVRGPEWRKLVDRITKLPETHEETLAFMLVMIRLNGCMECETDSYRAMRGCAACAQQSLRRYKGDDNELIEMYNYSLRDVRGFSNQNPQFNIETT